MALDIILLILRVAIVLVLYAFLGVLLYFIWQDVRMASQHFQEARHTPAKLVVTATNSEVPLAVGTECRLQPVTTLGRGPTNTVVLPDTFASTGHARISLRGNQWWLEDLESRNGTKLNGVVITGAVVLSAGDVIEVGRVKLKFEIG